MVRSSEAWDRKTNTSTGIIGKLRILFVLGSQIQYGTRVFIYIMLLVAFFAPVYL
jgi:hypothetical protein